MGTIVTKYAKECWQKLTGTSRVIPLPGGASVTVGQVNPTKIVVEDTDTSSKAPPNQSNSDTSQSGQGFTIKPPDQLQAKPVRLAWIPEKTPNVNPNSLTPPEDIIPEADRAFLPPQPKQLDVMPENTETDNAQKL